MFIDTFDAIIAMYGPLFIDFHIIMLKINLINCFQKL